jgi:hypothetical protein
MHIRHRNYESALIVLENACWGQKKPAAPGVKEKR